MSACSVVEGQINIQTLFIIKKIYLPHYFNN